MNRVYLGSCERMAEIPDASVSCCVTSPPYYGLREYKNDEQLGHETTVAAYVERLVGVFREVRRTLRDDGTAWLNLGDSYAGSWGAQSRGAGDPNSTSTVSRQRLSGKQIAHHPRRTEKTGSIRDAGLKPKDLMGVPWRVAFALQADGWWLRDAIVWAKPNPMPSSVTDRCTSAYETVFMLAKSRRYYADMASVKTGDSGRPSGNGFVRPGRISVGGCGSEEQWEPGAGANLRNVWTFATTPYRGDHPAVMPIALATRCIVIGSPPGGIVLDPFMGSGTTAQAALHNGRRFVGYETNVAYHAEIAQRVGLFGASV